MREGFQVRTTRRVVHQGLKPCQTNGTNTSNLQRGCGGDRREMPAARIGTISDDRGRQLPDFRREVTRRIQQYRQSMPPRILSGAGFALRRSWPGAMRRVPPIGDNLSAECLAQLGRVLIKPVQQARLS